VDAGHADNVAPSFMGFVLIRIINRWIDQLHVGECICTLIASTF